MCELQQGWNRTRSVMFGVGTGLVILLASSALAQGRDGGGEAESRGASPRAGHRAMQNVDVPPEQAQMLLDLRIRELDRERDRLKAVQARLAAGDEFVEASIGLFPQDRISLLRSARQSDEIRMRFGPHADPETLRQIEKEEFERQMSANPRFREAMRSGRLDEQEDGGEPRNRRSPRHQQPMHGGDEGKPSDVGQWGPPHAFPGREEIDAAERLIRDANPLLWAELERMREVSPQRYERMIADQVWRMRGDEEAFETAMRLDRADRELGVLTQRLRQRGGALSEEERSVLRSRIAAAYEARMQMLGHRLRRMEERMQQARAEHMKMLESRETMIDQRLREMEEGLSRIEREMEEQRGGRDRREVREEREVREQRGQREDREPRERRRDRREP